LYQSAEHEDTRERKRVFTLVLSGWHKVKSAVDKRQTSDEVNSINVVGSINAEKLALMRLW